VDIWVDELERTEIIKEGASEKAVAFAKRVSKLVEPLKRSPIKTVRVKAAESLEDDRLPWVESQEEDKDGAEEEDDGEWGGFDDK
ncbi:unnamed protein product, partial [Colletotrichum noveboracense]